MSDININSSQNNNVNQNHIKNNADSDIDFSAILAEIEDIDSLQNKKKQTKKLTNLLENIVEQPVKTQQVNQPYKVDKLVHDAINKINENLPYHQNGMQKLIKLLKIFLELSYRIEINNRFIFKRLGRGQSGLINYHGLLQNQGV